MEVSGHAQPNAVWINTGNINAPSPDPYPSIDATNFINQGSITFTNSTSVVPFGFADVLNYTNRGTMSSDTGFTFNNLSPSSGFSGRSAVFGNANVGKIYAKTGTDSNNLALSGYIITNQNKQLIFSVMVNNHQASASVIRKSIEKFITDIIEKY